MIEIILLIVGIFKAVQRPKLKRLTAQDYPDVDPNKFAVWQKAQLKATDIFLWATWGAFFIKLFITLAASGMRLSRNEAMDFIMIILIGWVIGLIIAGVFAGKARKLRLEAGISWPRPPGFKLKENQGNK
jgi:predicted histidine transporter YuiF (NhaC family)